MIFRSIFCVLLSFVSVISLAQTNGDQGRYGTSRGNTSCRFFDGFASVGDGTLTDPRNGLIWQRCAIGQISGAEKCEGNPSSMNWYAAMQAAKESRFGGKTDWRLPTVDELNGVVGDHFKGCDKNDLNRGQVAISGGFGFSSGYVISNSYFDNEKKWMGTWDVSFVSGKAAWSSRDSSSGGYDGNYEIKRVAYLVRDGSQTKSSEYKFFSSEYGKMAQYKKQADAANDDYDRRKRESDAIDRVNSCKRHYVGKTVVLKGGMGLTFDGEVRGVGNTMMTVRYNFLGDWKSAEFPCSDYP